MKNLLLLAPAFLVLLACNTQIEHPLAEVHTTAQLPNSDLYELTSTKDDCVLPKSNCSREVISPDVDVAAFRNAVNGGPDSIKYFFTNTAKVHELIPELLLPANEEMLTYLQGSEVYGVVYVSGQHTRALFSHNPSLLPDSPDFALRFGSQD